MMLNFMVLFISGLTMLPAEIETAYVVPMAHTDIGFTAPPRAVAEKASRYADQALEFARQDADYVWNFEVFWQLDQWLNRPGQPGLPPADVSSSTRPAASQPAAEDVRELLDLVRQGRFGIGAAYVNPHTALMSDWALDQLFRIPTQWAREHGLKLDWAVINDVPGHPPDLPHFLAANGVRYLALGVNQSLSKPLPAQVCNTPFWWEAPDGSRVLTWISSAAYIEAMAEYGLDPHSARLFNAKEFTQGETLEVIRRGMTRLREQYQARDYPYDAVLIFHAFDNWDPTPSSNLSAAIREWNESGGKPRLKLGTPGQFFRHIEAKYGPQLAVRQGGFGGQWELVRVGAPSAMARARAREQYLLDSGRPIDPADIRRLLVYWEHSYALVPPWPDLLTREQALEQNKQQWQMVADWPMPDRTWPAGQPVVRSSERDGPLEQNGLCLAGSAFAAWQNFEPIPPGAVVSSVAERLDDGVIRCRHRVDRLKLPGEASVIWSWKLNETDATAPVNIRTATGMTQWPDGGLEGYAQFHWIAPRGFKIGSTWFEPHGPFAFARSREPAGWLLACVLEQKYSATYKGGQKEEMTFEQVYQGEEPVYEFAIDIRSTPSDRAASAFFPLMAWDYAKDDATVQAMHECGINAVAFVPPKMLDVCGKYGMKAIVFDERVCGDDWTQPFDADRAAANLPTLIREVGDHPAVYGYHLKDEPVAAEFAILNKAAAVVRQLAPDKWPYINLLPGGGDEYDTYIEQFITTCQPPIVSYDRYVLGEDGEFSSAFWTNIAQVRSAAVKHGLPFHNIVLTAPHWHYREPTATDIRMQAFGSLVYGARGLAYYKFCAESLPILKVPDLGNFRMGPLDQFGEKTVTWEWLRNTNRQILNLAPVLLKLRSDDVYHFGHIPDRNHGATDKTLVKSFEPQDCVVGDFTHEDGSRYVMIVNKSLKHSFPCNPVFNVAVQSLEYVSPFTGKLTPYPMPLYWLAPGQGVLIKVRTLAEQPE